MRKHWLGSLLGMKAFDLLLLLFFNGTSRECLSKTFSSMVSTLLELTRNRKMIKACLFIFFKFPIWLGFLFSVFFHVSPQSFHMLFKLICLLCNSHFLFN